MLLTSRALGGIPSRFLRIVYLGITWAIFSISMVAIASIFGAIGVMVKRNPRCLQSKMHWVLSGKIYLSTLHKFSKIPKGKDPKNSQKPPKPKMLNPISPKVQLPLIPKKIETTKSPNRISTCTIAKFATFYSTCSSCFSLNIDKQNGYNKPKFRNILNSA